MTYERAKKPPRRLGVNDFDRILALWQAAGLHIKPQGRDSRPEFERQMAGGTQTVLGIEDDGGNLVGVVLATHDGRKGWINRLAVHPDHRRQGIGLALIEAAEVVLREQGMRIIAATIEPDNEASLALFRAAGYAEWEGIRYMSKRDSDEV
jgi:ribosomal protein S18 acetylase RimI-like enzyme